MVDGLSSVWPVGWVACRVCCVSLARESRLVWWRWRVQLAWDGWLVAAEKVSVSLFRARVVSASALIPAGSVILDVWTHAIRETYR